MTDAIATATDPVQNNEKRKTGFPIDAEAVSEVSADSAVSEATTPATEQGMSSSAHPEAFRLHSLSWESQRSRGG